MWSHSLFWSMLFNIGGYLACSLTFSQSEAEKIRSDASYNVSK